MNESDPVPQELVDRLARLESQMAWLLQRAQEGTAPTPGGAQPSAPRPEPPRPLPVRRRPPPPAAPREPVSPVVWIAGAGATLFLAGAAFFLRWSIQQGWLGPELRFVMGLAGGGAMAALAARLLVKGNPGLGVALLLAGLGTLVFIFRWGAFEHRFFPPTVGYMATFVCVALAGGLGARMKSDGALTVALLTGLAAPLVFSQGGQHQVALASYLAVLMGSALVVPYVSGVGALWHGPRWVGTAGTWALLALATFNVSTTDARLLLLLLGLHLALSGLWIWLPGQSEPRPGSPNALWVWVSVAFTGLAAHLWREELHWDPEAFALPVLGIAALNLGLVMPLRVRLESRHADLGLLALAAGHLALAVPIGLNWDWAGPLWACLAVGLAAAAGYAESHSGRDADDVRTLRRIATALACASTLAFFVHAASDWYSGDPGQQARGLLPFLNGRFAEGGLTAAAWALLVRGGIAWRMPSLVGLELVGGLAVSLELARAARYAGGTVRSASIVLTLTWALLGAFQWLRSLKGDSADRALTAGGYAWLGLASYKLIVADLADSDVPTKALAFLAVGGIFIAAALVGNRVRGGSDPLATSSGSA